MRKSTSFTPMQDLSAALVSLVASTAPSLVSVSSNRSQSSGFVWRPGLIVTADEALSEDGEFTIKLWNGNAVPAQLVGRDSTTDIALLRVDHTDLQPISLTPLTIQAGGPVIVVGAEDGEPTVAFGVVSRAAGPWGLSVVARSMRGLSLICVCGRAPKVVSSSRRPGNQLVWLCLDRVDAFSSYHRAQSIASQQSSKARGTLPAAI
jgi:S1-C subfamily serine protease